MEEEEGEEEEVEAEGEEEEEEGESEDVETAEMVEQAACLAELRVEFAEAGHQYETAHEHYESGVTVERQLMEAMEQARTAHADERQRQKKESRLMEQTLSRRAAAQEALEEAEETLSKLGSVPLQVAGAAGSHAADEGGNSRHPVDDVGAKGRSRKALWARMEEIGAELRTFTNVNKKALDQYATFADQRAMLRERRRELDEAEVAIQKLADH